MDVSVIIPAKNEAASLDNLLAELQSITCVHEIIVVNDGSTDNTSELCEKWSVREIKNPYSKGNGAAIKSGTRAAKGDILVFMDGDGQHQPADIPKLVEKLLSGYDMVVGARCDSSAQANIVRGVGNHIYNKISSWMTGHKILDLTSGFRAVRKKKFNRFLHLYPNGFSYPTTSTMAFFRSGYSVCYEPINVLQRSGKSHINIFRDGVRFFLIIFKVGVLYSPLRVFIPVSAIFFSIALAYYLYTYLSQGRFTNMSTLLFITSIIIFLMGLISEQITMMTYSNSSDEE